MKSFNKELDQRIAFQSTRKKKVHIIESNQNNIQREIDCLINMKKIYKEEIKKLQEKLEIPVDSDKLMALQNKLAESLENYNQRELEKKRLVRKIEEASKELKGNFLNRQDDWEYAEEEKSVRLLNRVLERAEFFEAKLKATKDTKEKKNNAIKALEQKVEKINEDVMYLKNTALINIEPIVEENKEDLEVLKKEMDKLNGELNSERNNSKDKITLLSFQVKELKNKLIELSRVKSYL